MNNIILGIICFGIAHLLTFYQLNGQFLKSTDWFKNNTFILALFGVIISYFYIYGTKYIVEGMEGLLWPVRFIRFGIGMLLYAILINYYFNEGITTKTLISLVLCAILIGIQVLWKTN